MTRRMVPSRQSWTILATDPSDPLAVGGLCRLYQAAAQLLTGDAVYLSAAGITNKSNVVGNHVLMVGVVVGGTATRFECIDDISDVGVVAAVAGDQVVVCHDGVAWTVAGAALAVPGTPIKPDTVTAGRVIAAVLGAGADQGKIIGRILEAAAGNGSAIRSLISIS